MRRLTIQLLIIALAGNSTAQNRYTLTCLDSASGKIKVSIRLASPKKTPAIFIMPRSVPGSYSIINYDNFVEEISATDSAGNAVTMLKEENGAPRWYAAGKGSLVREINYTVNLKKMEQRLDPTDASITRPGFAGILNYSVFGWMEGTEKEPVKCTVSTFSGWPIFSSNEPSAMPVTGNFSFNTTDYFTLADGQIFLGPKTRVKEFTGPAPLFIVSYAETTDEFLDDYGKQGMMSMEMLKDYFGELPFTKYSILLRSAIPWNGLGTTPFGMEHLQSSTFFGDTSGIRTHAMTDKEVRDDVASYLHHMGHAFIPLRCYGDAYRPVVKELPPIINNIWFNEGFMWFIPFRLLQIKGLKDWFDFNCYKAAPQIKAMSLSELSEEASLMYAADFRLGQAVLARGALMALEMDNYLRQKTSGKKTMKDVIRYLYHWSKQNKRPFTIKEFRGLIHTACGIDLTPIYNKWQLPIK